MSEANARPAVAQLESFQYESDGRSEPAPEWSIWTDDSEQDSSAAAEDDFSQKEPSPPIAQLTAEFDARLSMERNQAFELGRQQGRQEEDVAHEAALNVLREKVCRQAVELVKDFAQSRDRYFQAVENEVVELALCIASRVLRRQAQADPLLLIGAVRAALGQLADNTETRVIVSEPEVALWVQSLALAPNLPLKPIVIGNNEMSVGDCRIESGLGSADVSVQAQLDEIEHGFFDGDIKFVRNRKASAESAPGATT